MPPCSSETAPKPEPLLSAPTALVPGLLLGKVLDDSVMTTPLAAIRTPRTTGCAAEPLCRPAEEKTVEPADSDMKQPRKKVRPAGPPALANGFGLRMPSLSTSGCFSPTVKPAWVTSPVWVLRWLPSPAPRTLRYVRACALRSHSVTASGPNLMPSVGPNLAVKSLTSPTVMGT